MIYIIVFNGGNYVKMWKVVLIVIMALLIFLGFGYLQNFKQKTNNEVLLYLTDEKGYLKEEISEIYTQIGKAPVVSTTVIFSDELDSRYFYRKENGRIYQYSSAPVHGSWDGRTIFKHEEK